MVEPSQLRPERLRNRQMVLLSFVWPLLIWLVTVLNSTLSFIADHMPGASIEGLHPSALQTAMIYVIILSVYLIVLRYDQHY